ncbi:MAG: hypothetical protein PHF18_13885 [Methanosarcina sp.]|uniref:DUF7507 domain-containing protein n=1 Tax=Methanosarcina sp. TaxID=2213 RepID=UPI00262004B6|nr:hypothetical protein [Methanosarcina sp.]MDD3247917.1 hypothetical protein [Methanosarcina sp.]
MSKDSGNFYAGLKYFLCFILVFLLIVPASAASDADNELVAKGAESVLDENLSADQINPIVYESRIVWQERRGSYFDIVMYDLATGSKTDICTAKGSQEYPFISGDYIVWQDNRRGNWDIYMYDLKTGKEKAICIEDGEQTHPVVSAESGIVIWQSDIGMMASMYNLKTKERENISSSTTEYSDPFIDGDNAVWRERCFSEIIRGKPAYIPDLMHGVYLYNIAGGDSEPVYTSNSNIPSNPVISGGIVVWEGRTDTTHGKYDLYLCDYFFNKTRVTICEDEYNHFDPFISGRNVVWADDRNCVPGNSGNSDIYIYDIITGTEKQVCTAEGDQENPCIMNDKIVWQDSRNGKWNIYLFTLDPSEEIGSVHPEPVPALSVVKEVIPETVNPGDEVTVRVTLKNTGNVEINDIKVSDKVPEPFSLLKGETRAGYTSLGPAETKSFEYVVSSENLGAFDMGASDVRYTFRYYDEVNVESNSPAIEVTDKDIVSLSSSESNGSEPQASGTGNPGSETSDRESASSPGFEFISAVAIIAVIVYARRSGKN